MTNLSGQLLLDVPHARQQYDWDCGVACVLMCLSAKRRAQLRRRLDAVCGEEGFGRNTWTIDLCYLLRRYEVPHEYATLTLGVHPEYSRHGFYAPRVLADGARVRDRFEHAAAAGVHVSRRRVSLVELIDHLERRTGPVIVLTDGRLLACEMCSVGKRTRRYTPVTEDDGSNYQGHYVLLCGVNRNTRQILYRNPSLDDHICCMAYDTLEMARHSYGTDDDVILIMPCPKDAPA